MVTFNSAMCFCHLTSVTLLLLFSLGLLTDQSAIALELVLLCVKTVFEMSLADFTKDLAVHHLCMLIGSWTVSAFFHDHRYLVVYCQTIHIPLLLQYARRCAGAAPGGAADTIFLYGWCLIVGARNTLLGIASVRALAAWQTALLVILLPLTLLIGLLDLVWTRETFNKRRVSPSCWMVATAGVLIGAASDPHSGAEAHARVAWGAVCTAALAIVLGLLGTTRSAMGGAKLGFE